MREIFRDPFILLIVGVAALLGILFLAGVLSKSNETVFRIPWFIPTIDSCIILITISSAYLAFGRFRVLSDSTSFWTAIGSAGFTIGIIFHLLTFPDLLSPGQSIIRALPQTTAYFVSLAQSILSFSLLLTSSATWPRAKPHDGHRIFFPTVLLIGFFTLLNGVILFQEQHLPLLIGFGQKFSPLLLFWESLIGICSALGIVLSFKKYLRTKESFSAFIVMFQIVSLYIAIISLFTKMVRFNLTWHLLFFGWLIGLLFIFFGLLREYTLLFRREQEISQQLKKRQDELSESETRFRAVFEKAAVGMARVNFTDASWLDVNFAFSQMLGRSREEVLSIPWPKLTHPEDLELDLIPFKKMAAGEIDTYTVEKRFIHKDGHEIWARLSLSLVRNKDGFPDYEIAIIEDITTAKKALEALRSSETRFRSVMENMSEGVMLFDNDKNLIYQNPASLRIHGFDPDLGGKLDKSVVPQTWEAWNESGKKITFNEWPVSRVFRHEVFKDQVLHVKRLETGQEFHGSYNGSPVYDQNGNFALGFITIRDITSEYKAREALSRMHKGAQASAERVQLALAAGAIIGTWDWNLKTDQFTVDERFAEHFGIDPELGLTGLSLEQVISTVHPDDVEELRAAIAEAISRGGPYSHDYRVRGWDGVYRWIQANGRVEFDVEGNPSRFPGVLLDIEQRLTLESERDRLSQLLSAFIDAVPGVVFAKDKEGRMLVANRGVTELVGKPPEAYLGKTDLEILERKDQAKAIMANDQRIMQSGQSEIIEEEVNYPDGRKAVWLSTKAPFLDRQGNVVGLIGSSVDITSRKEIEAALRQRTEELAQTERDLQSALKTRDEFLSIASHELKTPLTSMRLQIQMVQRDIKKGKEDVYSVSRINRLVEQSEKQTARLARIVEDILDISRIRSGRLTIKKEEFDFCEMVRDVVERMKPELAGPLGLDPSVELNGCLTGEWDRTRIEQVLINLLTNAIRYGGGKQVSVKVTRLDSEHVQLSVIDQGIGIAEEDKERIFNRFERAVDANEVSGLGLGLSISKEIISAHQGHIWVESEPGVGSSFNVELPIKNET